MPPGLSHLQDDCSYFIKHFEDHRTVTRFILCDKSAYDALKAGHTQSIQVHSYIVCVVATLVGPGLTI